MGMRNCLLTCWRFQGASKVELDFFCWNPICQWVPNWWVTAAEWQQHRCWGGFLKTFLGVAMVLQRVWIADSLLCSPLSSAKWLWKTKQKNLVLWWKWEVGVCFSQQFETIRRAAEGSHRLPQTPRRAIATPKGCLKKYFPSAVQW